MAENAMSRMSLPHIMPLRDWELDLDKLEVNKLFITCTWEFYTSIYIPNFQL